MINEVVFWISLKRKRATMRALSRIACSRLPCASRWSTPLSRTKATTSEASEKRKNANMIKPLYLDAQATTPMVVLLFSSLFPLFSYRLIFGSSLKFVQWFSLLPLSFHKKIFLRTRVWSMRCCLICWPHSVIHIVERTSMVGMRKKQWRKLVNRFASFTALTSWMLYLCLILPFSFTSFCWAVLCIFTFVLNCCPSFMRGVH